MNRRNWLIKMSGLVAASALPFASASAASTFPLNKSKQEWRKLLSPEAYQVLFEEATERAGSSPLNSEKRAGTFICAACNQPPVRQCPQVRQWHGLAELLATAGRCRRYLDRFQADLPAHRISLQPLRWPSRTRFQ